MKTQSVKNKLGGFVLATLLLSSVTVVMSLSTAHGQKRGDDSSSSSRSSDSSSKSSRSSSSDSSSSSISSGSSQGSGRSRGEGGGRSSGKEKASHKSDGNRDRSTNKKSEKSGSGSESLSRSRSRDKDRDRDRNHDRRHHRHGDRDRGPHRQGYFCQPTRLYFPSNYENYQYGSNAYDQGYQEGLYTGANDAYRGQLYEPERSHFYKQGISGFVSIFGARDSYRSAYRDGFLRGYEEGFNNYQRYFVNGIFRR